jgi:hypothetical protein
VIGIIGWFWRDDILVVTSFLGCSQGSELRRKLFCDEADC